MTGYGQFCPVSKAAEVVCQRWTPLILRELLVGSTRFNEIRRGVPTCSPGLLSKRLKELEGAGVIERSPSEAAWSLTDAGRELVADGREVDLCLTDPGGSVDVLMDADLRALTRVWMGDVTFSDAVGAGAISLEGSGPVARLIPRWFGQHPILARVERAR